MACSIREEEDDKHLMKIPMRALNISFRKKLSYLLNPEQLLLSSTNMTRDYRGLAELMGFEHNDIQNFRRFDNPTMVILEAWGTKPDSSVGKLQGYLRSMERFDIIDDLELLLRKDVETFENNQRSKDPPLQDSEISSCLSVYDDSTVDRNILTIEDTFGQIARYDAYVCYADSDVDFVQKLAEKLEDPQYGIKLCIRQRDLILGNLEYDTFVRLVEERCRATLVILSPDFLNTCEYQAKFAASQASEQKNRRLIPIIYKTCEVPALFKYLSKVDCSKPDTHAWAWRKLIYSIQSPSSRQFVPPTSSDLHPYLPSPPNTEPNSSIIPILPSVPNSEIFLDAPGTSTGMGAQLMTSQSAEELRLIPSPVPGNSKRVKVSEKLRSFMRFSPSSSTSSGFHSQTDV